ncbi:glycosyltransferase family 2 protein [Pseudoalteromonas sp. 20-92]|uniref:glycosyltransferase family 2 protein n=1 Tax=Pseudoalteromonas sp. 20-92 TaxID=2969394 RepID=UPI0027B60154|nr:glycosyltransferase family 2 protein [Pseudoalteromonas sp. 20-92]MDQ2045224.1 glycosyltransferase family 2 protein [Pseudoalteromonas sp. 20-92]
MKANLGKKLAMNQCKRLGLVTVLYNSPEILNDFFESINNQKNINFHLYVIDNSSLSEPLALSKVLVEQYKLPVTFIDNKGKNVGVAAGNNQGIKAALSDGCHYIGLINNDLIFSKSDVLFSLCLSLNEYDLVTPKIYAYPEGDVWFEEGYFDNLRGTTPHSLITDKSVMPYAPTCFLICKSEIFEVCGIMDEWYFAYYDDSDFLYRVNKAGYQLGFIKSVYIQHKVSSSTGGSYSDFTIYYATRNRLYFIRKNIKKILPLFFTVLSRIFTFPKIKYKQYGLLVKAIIDGLRAKV